MRQSKSHAGCLLLAASVLLGSMPRAASAAPDDRLVTFRSPVECIAILKLEIADCAWIIEDAWRRYQDFVPRYPTREDCWRKHDICVAVQAHRVLADPVRGPLLPFVSYGPPLLGIRIRPDMPRDGLDVLIDRRMVELEIETRTPIPSVGVFSPGPEQMRSIYVRNFTTPPPSAAASPRRGTVPPGSQPEDAVTFGPVESYPVNPDRLRAMRRALQR